ncbi:MAG TPA: hypothetical protein VFT22_07215 [Kofleriaceae bacterium]|nr:hypothetical protein [Kofleriaceae bacterium]
MDALRDSGVDAETIALVESAQHCHVIVQTMTSVLLGVADAKQAKNYVKVEMTGISAPFERAYVELVRPGGKTSHELRELLRERLTHIRSCLGQDEIRLEAFRQGIIMGIDEDLATEEP